MEINKQQKMKALETAGWHTWYNPNYWVHSKLVADPKRQDYTDYGMSLDAAYAYEMNPKNKPFNGQLCTGVLRW